MRFMPRAVDLFAGPGGWSEACRNLHISEIGIEYSEAACETRKAAGHHTIQDDVRAHGPADLGDHAGLIGSPPCTAFSTAGKGKGRQALQQILNAIPRVAWGQPHDLDIDDPTADLVLEPLRWAVESHVLGRPYEWIALEQVPPVMPIWRAMADVLRDEFGYSVWCGNLQAEAYGVPQTRKRAILIAKLHGEARMPTPTHSRYYPRSPEKLDAGVRKWVSMAEALGWTDGVEIVSNYGSGGDASNRGVRNGDEPAATVTPKIDRNIVYRSSTMPNSAQRSLAQAAPTIAFGHDAASAGWALRSDNRPNSAVRMVGAPAPTILGNGERGAHARWEFAGAGQTAVDTAGQVRGAPDQPAHTITGKGTAAWCAERPSTTVNADPRLAQPGRDDPAVPGSQYGPETVRVTVQEAGILQSFPADYPWQGTKTAQYVQVGNAIPVKLAEAVLYEANRIDP